MVVGAITLAGLTGAGAPVFAGTLAGAVLMLLRRSVALPAALATGVKRQSAIWLVLAEDIVPGQSI